MKRILFKLLRGTIFTLVCLVTLIVLVVAEENWRGKRAWEAYKHAAEARGERLDFQPLIPPPVPDDQNFAMTPLLRPLYPNGAGYAGELQKTLELRSAASNEKSPSFGNRVRCERVNLDAWRAYFGGQDVLTALQKFDPQLREISEAARRPYSRFPLPYEKGCAMLVPHLGVLRNLGRIYTLRVCAELHEGRTDAALADVQTVFRLAESMKDEPLLISQLVRIALSETGLQAVWEGLADHRWTDAQLLVLQGDLGRVDFFKGMKAAFRGERAAATDTVLQVIKSPKILSSMADAGGQKTDAIQYFPRGWLYQNMLTFNRFHDATAFDPSDPVALRAAGARYKAAGENLVASARLRFLGISLPNPCKILAATVLPALNAVISRSVYEQVSVEEAMTACALERHRLAHGEYPETLDALAPQYFDKPPRDVITGGPLKYKRSGDGGFILYSVGWNETDDGGKVVMKDSGGVDQEKGDWVWSAPGR